VRIIFFIIMICLWGNTFSFADLKSVYSLGGIIFLPILIPWIISILAETRRAPFDLPEGEAELVSGFNVEFRAGLFAFIFIAEYSNVLIFRVVSSILFFSSFNIVIFSLIIASSTLWIRATLPIIRYDQLIYMAWKCFLPISIAFLLYSALFLCLVNFSCKLKTFIL
jgi:NADH-ubiquinone oxidoreductase chain 1